MNKAFRAPARPLRWLAWCLLFCLVRVCSAAAPDFLDPQDAFKLTVRPAGDRSVEVALTIAPGYYLYREQLKFAAVGAALGSVVLPQAHTKFDETFQKTVDIYRDTVRIVVPVEQADSRFALLVTNQGCADKGLCYPPQQRGSEVRLIGFGGNDTAEPLPDDRVEALSTQPSTSTIAVAPDDTRVDRALKGGRLGPVVGLFFVAGLLLSLTPCVLPMLPILSSAIVGAGTAVTRGRGLALAAAYSFGMAVVYTAFGIAAGLVGEGLSAALQNPWVLSLFAFALVLLSLSMFGAYELQLPAALSGRLTAVSQRLTPGRYLGVFAMGGVSALIVSPCVVAPLAGALLYLSRTRDVWLGGSALFALATGMSVPLLLLGASAGSLLPRAGRWMEDVKRVFGWVLLGVALWTVQSLMAPALVLTAWGVLLSGAAAMVFFIPSGSRGAAGSPRFGRPLVAGLLMLAGLLQFVGAVSGASNPLAPWAMLRPDGAEPAGALPFTAIRTVEDLDAALRNAGRPVMLDFYADWCVSCKEMERYTFVDPEIRRRLAAASLLRVDVTANTADDRALLRRFQLFGPPGTIFFDATGREIMAARVVGYRDVRGFGETLQTAGL